MRQLFSLDSTNVQPEHWIRISQEIREEYSRFDGFVITHGTDTMAYSAAALSYLIQNSFPEAYQRSHHRRQEKSHGQSALCIPRRGEGSLPGL